MELIIAIATLCQVNSSPYRQSDYAHEIDRYQLACQKYYVNCVGMSNEVATLKQCIKKREVR